MTTATLANPIVPGALPLASRDRAEVGMTHGLLVMLFLVAAVRFAIYATGVASVAVADPSDFDLRFASGRAWVAFDVLHYTYIAREGYPIEDVIPPYIAFFPLLPLIARVLLPLMSPETTLLTLAHLTTLVGMGFFYAWCRQFVNHAVALAGCLLLATFPASAFFSAGMTEGPFFCCVAMVLYLLQRDHLWLAAIVCGIASALRPTGVALALVIMLWSWPQSCKPAALARWMMICMISVSGIALYQMYLWHTYERFDAYFVAQSYWEPGGLKTEADRAWLAEVAAKQANEVRDARYYLLKTITPQVWNRGLMLAVLALSVYGLVRPGVMPRVVFVLPLVIFLMAYLPGWGARASSVARFQTAAVPCFLLMALLLARWNRPAVVGVILGVQLAAQLYYAMLFSRGIWIG